MAATTEVLSDSDGSPHVTVASECGGTIVAPLEMEKIDDNEDIKCSCVCVFSRLRLLFCPIRRWETIKEHGNEADIVIEVLPDAFRMLYYLYFFFFLTVGYFVTVTWSDLDLEDNPILNRFGSNNACIYFDDPPFNLFGSTLWFPAQILFIFFETFDYVRVYGHYAKEDEDEEHPITKGFLVYYTISTVIETISAVCFAQVFATSPREHIYMHTYPFIMLEYTFFFLVLKRFLYLRQVELVGWYWVLYVVVFAISTLIMMVLGISNLHGARLFETHPWTGPLASYNPWTWLAVFAPLISHVFLVDKLDTVVFTVNRKFMETKVPSLSPKIQSLKSESKPKEFPTV